MIAWDDLMRAEVENSWVIMKEMQKCFIKRVLKCWDESGIKVQVLGWKFKREGEGKRVKERHLIDCNSLHPTSISSSSSAFSIYLCKTLETLIE